MDILILMQSLRKKGFPDWDNITLLQELKKQGFDPTFHRLKYDGEGGYYW